MEQRYQEALRRRRGEQGQLRCYMDPELNVRVHTFAIAKRVCSCGATEIPKAQRRACNWQEYKTPRWKAYLYGDQQRPDDED